MEFKESIIIKNGRIHEVFANALALYAKDDKTWAEYSQSDGFKRRRDIFDKMVKHGHRLIERMIKREGLDWKKWQVVKHGSDSKTDVKRKFNQHYEIIKTE